MLVITGGGRGGWGEEGEDEEGAVDIKGEGTNFY